MKNHSSKAPETKKASEVIAAPKQVVIPQVQQTKPAVQKIASLP